jgi:hypothetical protein
MTSLDPAVNAASSFYVFDFYEIFDQFRLLKSDADDFVGQIDGFVRVDSGSEKSSH